MELTEQREQQQQLDEPNPLNPFANTHFSDGSPVVVQQPALGLSVDASPHPTTVEAPLDPSLVPEQEYNFTFRVEPSIGHRFSAVAPCIETGEEQSYLQESKEAAEKFVLDKVNILAANKAQREQERAEKAGQIKPFMAGDQVVAPPVANPVNPVKQMAPQDPIPAYPPGASLAEIMATHQTPLQQLIGSTSHPSRPAEPTLATPDQLGLVPNIPTSVAIPFYPGELVLKVRTDRKNPFHVIPELSSLVAFHLGGEEVEKAEATENGLKIITHPSFRKLIFSINNNGQPSFSHV